VAEIEKTFQAVFAEQFLGPGFFNSLIHIYTFFAVFLTSHQTIG